MAHIPLKRLVPRSVQQEILKTDATVLTQFLQDVLQSIAQPSIQKDIQQLVALGLSDPYATAKSTLEWIQQHYSRNNQVERLVQRWLPKIKR
jgi:hypothetical protein